MGSRYLFVFLLLAVAVSVRAADFSDSELSAALQSGAGCVEVLRPGQSFDAAGESPCWARKRGAGASPAFERIAFPQWNGFTPSTTPAAANRGRQVMLDELVKLERAQGGEEKRFAFPRQLLIRDVPAPRMFLLTDFKRHTPVLLLPDCSRAGEDAAVRSCVRDRVAQARGAYDAFVKQKAECAKKGMGKTECCRALGPVGALGDLDRSFELAASGKCPRIVARERYGRDGKPELKTGALVQAADGEQPLHSLRILQTPSCLAAEADAKNVWRMLTDFKRSVLRDVLRVKDRMGELRSALHSSDESTRGRALDDLMKSANCKKTFRTGRSMRKCGFEYTDSEMNENHGEAVVYGDFAQFNFHWGFLVDAGMFAQVNSEIQMDLKTGEIWNCPGCKDEVPLRIRFQHEHPLIPHEKQERPDFFAKWLQNCLVPREADLDEDASVEVVE